MSVAARIAQVTAERDAFERRYHAQLLALPGLRVEAQTLNAQVVQLCYDIETLPASERQTQVSLAASKLRSAIEKFCSTSHG